MATIFASELGGGESLEAGDAFTYVGEEGGVVRE